MIQPYIRKINYYETDRMGITHHSNYIRIMEEARVDFLDQIGCSFAHLEALGIVSPVLSVNAEYKHTTTFDDTISVKVSLLEFNGIKAKIGYVMTLGDVVCCTAESRHCFLNKEGIPLRMKKEFPEIYELLCNQLAKTDAD